MKTAPLAAAAAALLLMAPLAACSSNSTKAETSKPKTSSETAAPKQQKTSPKTSPTGQVEWSENPIDIGELIGSGSSASWQGTVYQVGTGVSASDSGFVDSNGKNLLPAGSDLVYLNFVLTNTSDKPITVSYGATARPIIKNDSEMGQDYSSDSQTTEFERLGLTTNTIKVGAQPPFTVQPGEAFAVATNAEYLKGMKSRTTVSMTPVKDGTADELDHGKSEQVNIEFTIK